MLMINHKTLRPDDDKADKEAALHLIVKQESPSKKLLNKLQNFLICQVLVQVVIVLKN